VLSSSKLQLSGVFAIIFLLLIPASIQFIDEHNSAPASSSISLPSNDKISDHYTAPTRSNISLDGSFKDWDISHLLCLDPVGDDSYHLSDGFDNSRDLAAAYMTQDAESLYFRLDYYDLAFQAESGNLDSYVLLDFVSGGEVWTPDYSECQTDSWWDIAIALYDSGNFKVYYSDWTEHDTHFLGANYHSQFDCVEFGLDKDALSENGYGGTGEIRCQFFTTKDGTNDGAGEIPGKADLVDTIPDDRPWEDDFFSGNVSTENPGTLGSAKVGIFHHGNQFVKNVDNFVKDENGLGFWKVPEIHEKWDVPVNLHVSGTLAEGAQWFKPEFNQFMRQLVDDEIVHMVGGFYNEYIPQYIPEEVNLWSMEYAREMIEYYYNDTDVPFCWVPERVFWDGYEYLVKDGGYEAVMVDTENGFRWYAEPQGHTDEYKLYEEDNGLKVLFISNAGGAGAGWNVQDQIHNSYDGGLAMSLRGMFYSLASSPDQDQYALYMDDWEKTCGNIPLWGGAGVVDAYENSIAWMSVHPWVQVVPMEELLDLPIQGEVDIDDCTYFWLSGKTGSLNNKDNAGNLYDAWYYDPLEEISHVSYEDYVPYDCQMSMGDYNTPNTIIGDTWDLVHQIPSDSPFYNLAFKTFSNGLYETAWFEGEWPDIYIPYWQKEQAAHIRCAALYYYAHEWFESSGTDRITARSLDLDMDGGEEYILSNEDVFCVFEKRGGKLIAALDSHGDQIVGNQPTGWLTEGDYITDAITSTTTNTHFSGEYLGMAESPGAQYLRGSKTFAFSDMGNENDIYQANLDSNSKSLTFQYGDITKTYTLSGKRLRADYSISGRVRAGGHGIRFSFSPDLDMLLEEGPGEVELVTGDQDELWGWQLNDVVGAVELNSDLEYSNHDSNVANYYVELNALSDNFHADVHLGRLDSHPPVNTPPRAILISPLSGSNITDDTPLLSWEGQDSEGDDIYYKVLLDGSGQPSAELLSNTSDTSYSVSPGTLELNTTYYWTVIPYDHGASGTCVSGIWSFTLVNDDSPAVMSGKPRIQIMEPELNVSHDPLLGIPVRDVITISGRAFQGDNATAVESVEISIGSQVNWTDVDDLTDAGQGVWQWQHDVNTLSLSDGSVDIAFRAYDGRNYSDLDSIRLLINNTSPGPEEDDDTGDDDTGDDDTGDDDDDDTGDDDDNTGLPKSLDMGPFLTSDGKPIPGAVVELDPQDSGGRKTRAGNAALTAVTDVSGTAVFTPHPAPGNYRCIVKKNLRTVISSFDVVIGSDGSVLYNGTSHPPSSVYTLEEIESLGNVNSGNSDDDNKGKICLNVLLMFVLPMLVIVIAGILIEIMVKRLKVKKKK